MFDTVQTISDFAVMLFLNCFFHLLKEHYHQYEYHDLASTGICDRNINFAGTKIFIIFGGHFFDRPGYHLGARAISSYKGAISRVKATRFWNGFQLIISSLTGALLCHLAQSYSSFLS